MSRFLYENFYAIESMIGAVSIGIIAAECIAAVRRSSRSSEKLKAAIEKNHRLDAEELNRSEVEKKIKAMQERMSKRKRGAEDLWLTW